MVKVKKKKNKWKEKENGITGMSREGWCRGWPDSMAVSVSVQRSSVGTGGKTMEGWGAGFERRRGRELEASEAVWELWWCVERRGFCSWCWQLSCAQAAVFGVIVTSFSVYQSCDLKVQLMESSTVPNGASCSCITAQSALLWTFNKWILSFSPS